MEKIRIDTIFTKGRSIQVPFFQRSYVWNEDNWKRFIEDMTEVSSNNKDYFLGTYIMKQQEAPSTGIGDVRTIIDGQQRFTTIILFFYVLYKKMNNLSEFKDLFFNRENNIILKHNHNDQEIFESIINGALSEELRDKYKNNQVLKAYLYFEDNIDISTLNVNILLNKLYFVSIDVQQNEDEQQIFDTINSLGVRLTTAELLKNYLFSSLDDIELYNTTWKNCFEKDTETKDFWDELITSGSKTRNNIDMLLYSYLSIFYKKEFTIDTLFNTFKEYLKDVNYKNNKIEILNTIKDYADLYKKYIKISCCNETLKDKCNSINRLNLIFFGLDTTTLIPYCLYVLKNSDEEEQNKIFGFLETYVMRRLVCESSAKNYNNMFQSFIRNKILTYDALKEEIYSIKKEYSKNAKMPSNDELKESIYNNVHTNKKAKGILYLLESALRDENSCTALLAFSKYDLEHIMPRKWEDNWALSEPTQENKENRYKHVEILGNKTLLTSPLNKSIKNAKWEIKVHGNGTKDGFDKYARGLITFDFHNISHWDEDVIDNRNNTLFEYMKQVWNID